MQHEVQINNRRVECPHCQKQFTVRHAPRGCGASYTQDWTHIPFQLARIIEAWLMHINTPQTKVSARALLNKHGLHLSENAAGARISELLGLKVLEIVSDEYRHAPSETRHAPEYHLNKERALQIINNGGRIR